MTSLSEIPKGHLKFLRASLVAQTVKNPPRMQETRVQSLGREDPLEKEMATHSSTLAWRIPWGHKESDTIERLHFTNEDNGDLLQKVWCTHCHTPNPAAGHCQPTPLLETPGHSLESLCQSLVGSLLLSPGSWRSQDFVFALQESVSPVLCKFCNQIPVASKVKFSWSSQPLCQIPRLGNLLWVLELS